MGRKTVYIHRVGTITAGITLVLTGVLFLVRLFFPFFDHACDAVFCFKHFFFQIFIFGCFAATEDKDGNRDRH